MPPVFLAPNTDSEGFWAPPPPSNVLLCAGAFEAGFTAKGLGCDVEAVEGFAANGLGKAPPLLSGACAAGFTANGFDEGGEGFDVVENGLGAAAGFCEAGGQPLPPKEDIVFAEGGGHLGRWADRS